MDTDWLIENMYILFNFFSCTGQAGVRDGALFTGVTKVLLLFNKRHLLSERSLRFHLACLPPPTHLNRQIIFIPRILHIAFYCNMYKFLIFINIFVNMYNYFNNIRQVISVKSYAFVTIIYLPKALC